MYIYTKISSALYDSCFIYYYVSLGFKISVLSMEFNQWLPFLDIDRIDWVY